MRPRTSRRSRIHLVAAITPMFSPYVVVPEPPPKPAIAVPRPSANSAVPICPS